jgi:short subunit dehydrogenase-like uncharacterized protein
MRFLIYGAYGYTGELISRLAREKGFRPILAGRNGQKTAALADELGFEYLTFSLGESEKLNAALKSVDLILHCAGPFSNTAKPMMLACLETNTHYLDITGEYEVFEYAYTLNKQAIDSGVLLLPGVGFDVVPSDCLANQLRAKLPDATHLELAFMGESTASRGTSLTMIESIPKGGAIRKEGLITSVPIAHKQKTLNLDGKDKTFVSIPWGDVSTAFHSSGIPNVIVYTAMHPGQIKKVKMFQKWNWVMKINWVQNYFKKKVKAKVVGPSEESRNKAKSYLWGQVVNSKGDQVSARLTTLEGYKLTSITALLIIEELSKNSISTGFHTPASLLGSDFILQVENTSLLFD